MSARETVSGENELMTAALLFSDDAHMLHQRTSVPRISDVICQLAVL